MKATTLNNIFRIAPLVIICALAVILALPTINQNLNDPNMIVYLNADEGGLMDLAWYYYSGHKRDSFQWDFDYGLEKVYLADMVRPFSSFVRIAPGTFVFILRWLHLLAWIGALIALWRLIGRHFGLWWQQVLAVLLLAVRPAYAYLLNNLKPEPLVILFMIIGLDYALRIVEKASWKNMLLATACASLAFMVKYAGIFLLPAIIFAMYFSRRRSCKAGCEPFVFPRLDMFWVLPALSGIPFILGPITVLTFYVRKSAGTTWVAEYGVWGALVHNKVGLYSFYVGISMIVLSALLWIATRLKMALICRIMDWVKEVSSYALIALGSFIVFTLFIGVGWLFHPQNFIMTYAFLGVSGSHSGAIIMAADKGVAYAFFYNILMQIKQIDPIILFMVAIYIAVEVATFLKRKAQGSDMLESFKRFTLLIFLAPLAGCVFSMVRLAGHHVVPFFAAMSILALQGISMLIHSVGRNKLYKYAVICIAGALLAVDICGEGASVASSRIYMSGYKEDVAYEISRWWKDNIPKDSLVIAEEYTRAYVPQWHDKIVIFKSSSKDRNELLRKLVDADRPDYIYYNAGQRSEGEEMLPIEQILPNKRVKLVKSFESAGRPFQRDPGARYDIYKILYE